MKKRTASVLIFLGLFSVSAALPSFAAEGSGLKDFFSKFSKQRSAQTLKVKKTSQPSTVVSEETSEEETTGEAGGNAGGGENVPDEIVNPNAVLSQTAVPGVPKHPHAEFLSTLAPTGPPRPPSANVSSGVPSVPKSPNRRD